MVPRREKIFNIPAVIAAIVVLLVAIEAVTQMVSPETYLGVLEHFAFVPGRFTYAFDPGLVSDAFDAADSSESGAGVARFFLGDGSPQWWTPVTYAFLHAGWLHVGVNSLWFVAFGSAVARRFGPPRFLLFCIAAAVAGAALHFLTHMTDLQPVVGASAVVSGAMAAAARFVFQPGAPLGETLGFADRQDEEIYRLPALPLRELFSNRGAATFLGFWFLMNFVVGVVPASVGMAGATIAWEAHIGGFLVGLLAFRWFDPKPPFSVGRGGIA
ncbi:rhomboid family intramembrane serine protease [Methylocapsa palsarum]|uniref:Membrane associated serine protease, rhomboid family n=1 Tax=Methylocapsa palsarum TaxID=1612308 RepID=A0A1I3WSJ9_9HYPH|nr:rhomboid family intramembrane serine protease [Methylocapsa palsarum]SFK10320.1 Membrane associated serine protease, rhomboid family [Methylocapsa palsarum]